MKLSRSEEAVLMALFHGGGGAKTDRELATMLGYHRGHVRKARKALEGAGLVRSMGWTPLRCSSWNLTEDGLGEAIARQVGGDARMAGPDA